MEEGQKPPKTSGRMRKQTEEPQVDGLRVEPLPLVFRLGGSNEGVGAGRRLVTQKQEWLGG